LEASIDVGALIVADDRDDVEAQKRLGKCGPGHGNIAERGMVFGRLA